MIRKDKIIYLLLGTIFLLGIFLRLYRLNLNMPELYSDEVGGQYWYSNWVHNNELAWPIQILRGTITSPTSLAWVFGFSPLIARLPAAINGSILIVVFYLFSFYLFGFDKNKKVAIGLVGALLVALAPWSFSVSRLYGNIPFILILVLIHLILVIKSNRQLSKIISLVPLFFSAYYYPSMVILIPIITILVGWSIWKDITKDQKRIFVPVLSILFICFVFFAQSRFKIFDAKSRGLDLAIWRDTNVTADANLYRGIARQSEPTIFSFGQDPEKIANKLVFNYPISIISAFTKNYLSFFSPNFLFLKGDGILRHSTSMVGSFYTYLIPFMLYGAFVFFRDQTTKNKILFITWILASPIPAAITKDGATYLLRAVTLMPFLTYFCALGMVTTHEVIKSSFLKMVYVFALSAITLFSAYYYFYGYFHVYPALSANSFEYGFKELADFQAANPGKMLIIWDDKYPFTHFCFWQNLPYSVCDLSKIDTRVTVGDSRVDLPLPEVIFSLPKSQGDLDLIIKDFKPVFLVIPNKYIELFPAYSKNYSVNTINNPDKTIAFEIYEI
jgi:hypothetical protein